MRDQDQRARTDQRFSGSTHSSRFNNQSSTKLARFFALGSDRSRLRMLILISGFACMSGVVVLASVVRAGVLAQTPTAILVSLLGLLIIPGLVVALEAAARREHSAQAIREEHTQTSAPQRVSRHPSHGRSSRIHSGVRTASTDRARETTEAA